MGLVRLTSIHHKHRFLTAPMGVACPTTLSDQHRVVLVDHPLLAMRLHQAGIVGVALVDDPAVLPPLQDWLRGRTVILGSPTQAGLAALRRGLGDLGAQARGVVMGVPAHRLAAALRQIEDVVAVAPATPPPASTPAPSLSSVLRDLHAYAAGSISSSAGVAALRAIGLDHPDALRAYRPGYLPSGYRDLLPAGTSTWDRLPDAGLILPAYDEAEVLVDLCAVPDGGGPVVTSLHPAPRGLLAPVLATACDKVVIVDDPAAIGRPWSSTAPSLLLRGVADAQANAARLAAGGVRVVEVRVQRDAEAIATALRAAGITVAAPAIPTVVDSPADDATASGPPAPTLTLVRHDAHAEQATFRWGALTLTVQVPWGTSTTLEVVVEAGGLRHRDRLDLAQDPQRQRFAQVAAIRLRVPVPDLVAALTPLLPAVQTLARPAPAAVAPRTTTEAMTEAERAEALALLRDEHLLERLTADLDVLGWAGDPDAKALTLLAAVSRLSPDPVWIALTATDPAERFPGLAALAAITPPEHLLHASRLTDHALVNTDPDALRHKLLLIDDARAISTPVATALKVLRAQGGLTGTTVERDALGQMRTRFVLAPGPVAVVTAAAGDLPSALRHHLVEVPVDESPGQESRRLAHRLHRLAAPVAGMNAQVITRWHNAQRLLRTMPVSIPTALSGSLPPALLRRREAQEAVVGLIAAGALLHQHQRTQVEGAVVATAADVDQAVRLLGTLSLIATSPVQGLGPMAHLLAQAMAAAGQDAYTMADLAALLPDRCRWSLRQALDALVAVEVLSVERRGRGRGGMKHYHLATMPVAPGKGAILADWRHFGGSSTAISSPEVACG